MLKIDTHAHYLPRDWPDLAAKYGDARFPVIHHGDDGRHRIYKDGKFFREIWPKTWDRRIRIDDYARLRRAGAGAEHRAGDVQLLGQAAPGTGAASRAQRPHGTDLSRLSAPLRRHRHGAAAVPQLAIRELERCMDRTRPAGRADRFAHRDWNLDAPALFDFFQAASDLGAAILVHPGT
jgi:aminocarboxymuconate-semialdehyde decarboxylase